MAPEGAVRYYGIAFLTVEDHTEEGEIQILEKEQTHDLQQRRRRRRR
jgi:hypothetical protein